MSNLKYLALFGLLLAMFLFTFKEMSVALDEIDIARFYFWTSIATAIAGLPIMLW
jgi:hypothetical protein